MDSNIASSKRATISMLRKSDLSEEGGAAGLALLQGTSVLPVQGVQGVTVVSNNNTKPNQSHICLQSVDNITQYFTQILSFSFHNLHLMVQDIYYHNFQFVQNLSYNSWGRNFCSVNSLRNYQIVYLYLFWSNGIIKLVSFG